MRTTKQEMMKSAHKDFIPKSVRIVAPNTLKYDLTDGSHCIQLHKTIIMQTSPNGWIRLDSGGWKTKTTKERMNRFLSGFLISQKRGLWYVSNDSWENRVPYIDGIILVPGKPLPTLNNSREKNLLKQITTYCKKLRKHIIEQGLPRPSSGDCFYCSMLDVKTGKPISNPDHLISHLEEGYITGSLIVNAIRDQGYGNADSVLSMRYNRPKDFATDVVQDVRKYLKRQLGLCR